MRSATNRRALGALVTLLVLLGVAAPASTATPSTGPEAASSGARWLAAQVATDGSVAGGFDPLGDAGSAALALAAAGVEADAFARAVGHVVDNLEAYVAPFGGDNAGRLGRALLLADAAGFDPTDVGGVDLVARLQATLGAEEPGLYGTGAPDFDGVFRQGLAILGLVAVGETPAAAAVTWLRDQQCGPAQPASTGGWESYRADTAVACAAPDGASFTGPDSNATASAVMALAALGQEPDFDALGYLARVQEADGGWSYQAGSGTDPNSTALVMQALVARGEDPGTWGEPGARPMDSLLSWVVPCGQPDAGAFASPFSHGAGDVFATLDAIGGAAGTTLPLDGPVTLSGPAADPCTEDPDGPGEDTGPVGPTPAVPTAPPATPVAATPTFTG